MNILRRFFLCCCLAVPVIASAQQTVPEATEVHTADELIAAIRPGATIRVSADTLRLRDIAQIKNFPEDTEGSFKLTPYVRYLPGNGIAIEGVDNLSISGMAQGRRHTVISSHDEGDFILTFRSCKKLRLRDFEASHLPRAVGGCTGGVLFFDQCSKVQLEDLVLIGSGRCGIQCDDVKGMSCLLVTIDECSSDLLELKNDSALTFESCTFRNTKSDGGLIFVEVAHDVTFRDCSFSNNEAITGNEYYKPENDCVFRFYYDKESTNFLVENCEFENNRILHFSNKKEVFTRKGNKYTTNKGLQEGE